MSYCIFSCNDFQSNIYCYSDVNGGITIHVATNRVMGDIPKCSHLFEKESLDQYFEMHNKQMEWLKTAERQDIGLEFDGQDFNVDTPQEAFDLLTKLRETGYNVPQHAIDSLEEDIA